MSTRTAETPAHNHQSLVIATAGHVDHGKTALVQQITGTNTDTLAEEQTRGLTINPGFAYYHLPDTDKDPTKARILGIVDVPGHTDFINNMLAGTASVDGALLVVAADDGIMPQTREHLAILDILGLNLGFCVITKIDRVDEARTNKVTSDIQQLLASTSLSGIPIFPVSNASGAGISEVNSYIGEMFAEITSPSVSSIKANPRFLIDRAFTIKGSGTVVTGALRAGTLDLTTPLQHSASGEDIRIKGMRLDKSTIQSLKAGERAALNVNLPHDGVRRGDWLVSPGQFNASNRMDVQIKFNNTAFVPNTNTEYHFHIGASHHVVNIRPLCEDPNAFFQIRSKDLIIASHGDRFVVRDPAAQSTIGGGKVIDLFVPRRGRASEARLTELSAMDNSHDSALLELADILSGGLSLEEFALNRNLDKNSLLVHCKNLGNQYHLLPVTGFELPVLLHEKFHALYSKQILQTLQSFHEQTPSQQGMSEPALSKAINFERSHLLLQALLSDLQTNNSIVKSGTLFHLPDHKARLSPEEEKFLQKVRPILLRAGKIPPRTRELVDLIGIPLVPLERILRQTTKAGSLIQIADNRHYLPETIVELALFTEKLAEQADDEEGFSVIQFRDASGIGRNLCIEILEYFDRIGYTRREGNTRILRTSMENVFGG